MPFLFGSSRRWPYSRHRHVGLHLVQALGDAAPPGMDLLFYLPGWCICWMYVLINRTCNLTDIDALICFQCSLREFSCPWPSGSLLDAHRFSVQFSHSMAFTGLRAGDGSSTWREQWPLESDFSHPSSCRQMYPRLGSLARKRRR